MQLRQQTIFLCALVCAALCGQQVVHAHGFEGNRFFPPTLATDDPFAVDELALPSFTFLKNAAGDDGPSNHEYDLGFEFDKEIFPYFAVGVSNTYVIQKPKGDRSVKGWSNLTLTAKYEFLHNAEHEMIMSIGLEADL